VPEAIDKHSAKRKQGFVYLKKSREQNLFSFLQAPLHWIKMFDGIRGTVFVDTL
jgi:virulence-associated protein VapD